MTEKTEKEESAKSGPKNLAASVRQRLLNISRSEGRDFQEVLTRFALERLLYRLGHTIYAEEFILKGALLFVLWTPQEIHRFTQDMDLLGFGEPSTERLASIMRAVCEASVEDDALLFDPQTVSAMQIREENIYSGVRIKFTGFLGRARIPIQIDVGFGDAVIPEPEEHDFPVLLSDFPAPHLRAYRRETSIAEKFLAIVTLQMDNTRMKDYFDIWLLSRDFSFAGAELAAAMRATFERRQEVVPAETPIGVTSTFSENGAKKSQWSAFVRQRVKVADAAPPLTEVVDQIAAFLLPVLDAVRTRSDFNAAWSPGGPWILIS